MALRLGLRLSWPFGFGCGLVFPFCRCRLVGRGRLDGFRCWLTHCMGHILVRFFHFFPFLPCEVKSETVPVSENGEMIVYQERYLIKVNS